MNNSDKVIYFILFDISINLTHKIVSLMATIIFIYYIWEKIQPKEKTTALT